MVPPMPLVGPPMHPLRPLREGLHHVRATSETLPDGLRLVQSPVHLVVPLALVDEVVAMAAQEVAPWPVQDRDSPAASCSGTDEPRPLSPEVARRPDQGHWLLHILP